MSEIMHNPPEIICYVADKTGGHMLPCITHAHEQQEKNQAITYLFHTDTPLERTILEKHPEIEGYAPYQLDRIPYNQPWNMPIAGIKFVIYFCKSVWKLWRLQPKKVISFGGFSSIPVCLAAKILGIPVELYELNVEPGKTIKFLSHFSDHVHICFQDTCSYFDTKKCILTNYPLRFSETDKNYNQSTIKKELSLDPKKFTITILGGSQGSESLNKGIINVLETLPKNILSQIQILHQAGNTQLDLETVYKNLSIPYKVVHFYNDIIKFYQAGDLIICRSGAGTIFETLFFQKKCITIPLETNSTSHQIQNAQSMATYYPDYFTMILQKPDWEEKIRSHIINILS